MKTLCEAYIPELPNYYHGKVRENYNLEDGTRITITTDRLSAFDRILTCIPYKGQALTQITRYWFDNTIDICPNHATSYPDPNVIIGQQLNIFPIEFIVRGYLAGNTKTSLLSLYNAGHREIYGYLLPDNMRANQKLPTPLITPTSKNDTGNHDQPISHDEIIHKGLLTEHQWEKISFYALALFERGCKLASECDLILVDTKYEFGLDKHGEIILADEIHTPDSSRYWEKTSYQKSYNEGVPPISLDKDFVRRWVFEKCNPYKEQIPTIPSKLIHQTSDIYINVHERITGLKFSFDNDDTPLLSRIRKNLSYYF
ncbi:Phosphoribosylaminoimidazole-succinocarboxamide synthase [Liberibacter crescens BT-1]|uniref:Phosphoribosylaminoimidazole-succinocarboxamide synthase n=1 Tax=Liberibacter crescens (strain BT-1) TaxID=1215343 RepID=L0EVJ5_LIBCB|nr:phosphoribosylaminoimidazolesuccinocarboxamide synthase [Liberibacter crescens]AGA64977.1 Phosphoribosylaminoimidazole-succinocarboxamide synthase [Liberibacter crescens BT-1]AMC12996.1 phosphoribosylaminoimidazole-succinocarboxamide synthase [Liberibacter crescens]